MNGDIAKDRVHNSTRDLLQNKNKTYDSELALVNNKGKSSVVVCRTLH